MNNIIMNTVMVSGTVADLSICLHNASLHTCITLPDIRCIIDHHAALDIMSTQ